MIMKFHRTETANDFTFIKHPVWVRFINALPIKNVFLHHLLGLH